MAGSSSTSLEGIRNFRALSSKAKLLVMWVPAHSGVQGNEEVDAIDRATLRKMPTSDTQLGTIIMAYLHRVANHRRQRFLTN